jgi:hypothetical protein
MLVDLLSVIENMVNAISPDGGGLTRLMYIMSWLIGVVTVIMAVRGMSQRSEMGRNAGSWAAPVWTFIIGICFLVLPGLVYTISETVFGTTSTDASEIFSYAPATVGLFESESTGRAMIEGIVVVVQFVGYIGVMRGLFILKATANGYGNSKSFGPGMTFVIAGAMAANFPLFVGLIEGLLT